MRFAENLEFRGGLHCFQQVQFRYTNPEAFEMIGRQKFWKHVGSCQKWMIENASLHVSFAPSDVRESTSTEPELVLNNTPHLSFETVSCVGANELAAALRRIRKMEIKLHGSFAVTQRTVFIAIKEIDFSQRLATFVYLQTVCNDFKTPHGLQIEPDQLLEVSSNLTIRYRFKSSTRRRRDVHLPGNRRPFRRRHVIAGSDQ